VQRLRRSLRDVRKNASTSASMSLMLLAPIAQSRS
jgi:hypothetical protein